MSEKKILNEKPNQELNIMLFIMRLEIIDLK